MQNIKPGDLVVLGPESGLGRNPFLVLEVRSKELINPLYVRGSNGATWWARLDGTKVVSSAQSCA